LITKDRNYRKFAFESRSENDKKVVVGMPVIFDRETVLWEHDGIEYKEKVAATAFDGAKMDDVVLNIDHMGKPAAKTKNGTLRLEVRADGLYMEADLGQNATGRELYEDIQNGFYDKMSFSFAVSEESYDRDTHTRTILKFKQLYDVSAVTFPAYEQTNISARSWAEARYEIEAAEVAAAEVAKRDAEVSKVEVLKLKNEILGGL